MNRNEKIAATVSALEKLGWEPQQARQFATEAVEQGKPILETLCFHELAQHILASIHKSSWIKARSEDEEWQVVQRLLDAGAAPDDLAIFARLMQREYLSNLGCILDGSGIYGTPRLPYEDFRVFAVDDSGQPQVAIEDLHESLGFSDLETEMKLSREAEMPRP